MPEDSTIESKVVDILGGLFPKQVGLHEPVFKGQELKYVKECVTSGWVSSVGSFVNLFEKQLAELCGTRYAVATVNGTAALHVAIALAGVLPGDEVLIPTLTFIATANAVSYVGAIPHFLDSEEQTLGIDPDKLDEYLSQIAEVRDGDSFNRITGRRMKALVPMHTFGHPVRLDRVADVARKHSLVLIEDAAESLGSYYMGRHTGQWGELSTLSFNGNKVVTTGGGGAIVTNNEELARRAKHITTTAKIPHEYEFFHDTIGYNYRLPNINAALGVGQLEQLDEKLHQKRELLAMYRAAFEGFAEGRIFEEPENCRSNYWLQTLVLTKRNRGLRNSILKSAIDRKIGVRPTWNLMHSLPMYANYPKMDLSVSESLEDRIICLPSSPQLTEVASNR